jgi:hypothetical protein
VCKPAVWNSYPFAQYRKITGKEAKKRQTCPEMPKPLPAVRSSAECLAQYEQLHSQALETSNNSAPYSLEMAFMERQGLAAWMDADWDKLSDATGIGI